jgi:putative membrane protein
MKIIIKILLNGLAVFATDYLLSGVLIDSFWTAIIVGLVLGVMNALVKPVLLILTLPITIITLGLFSLVINAVIILLTSALVPGFMVENFWWAALFGLVLSVINWFLGALKD